MNICEYCGGKLNEHGDCVDFLRAILEQKEPTKEEIALYIQGKFPKLHPVIDAHCKVTDNDLLF